MPDLPTCPTCGGELLQKSQDKLLLIGILMLVEGGAGLPFSWFFRIAGVSMILSAIYLIVWATRGRGLWCRKCKRFPVIDSRS